jgi:YidC/Oxa1 family membrane protein insertase
MDKKAVIAISLSILVMVVWQVKFAPKFVPPPPPAEMAPSAAPEAASTNVAPASPAPGIAAPAPSPEPLAEPITQKVTVPSVEYTFTNLGGGIAEARLLKHQGDASGNVVMNQGGPTPIGAIATKTGEGLHAPYELRADAASGGIICERTTPDQVLISKKFTLPKETEGTGEYLVHLDVSFRNDGAQPYGSAGWNIYTGAAGPIHKNDLATYTSFNWYALGKLHSRAVTWFEAGRIPLLGIQTSTEKAFFSEDRDKIVWAGVRNQYFATIVTSAEGQGSGVWTRRFHPGGGEEKPYLIEGALTMPGFTLAPGESRSAQFQLWIGPKEYDRLKRLGQRQDEIMEFGMFKWVSEFLLTSMNWLHSIFENFGGYAMAIIILTICIRSAMWPLVNKSTQSMKKMQAIQPKMTELREKYKDDPTRMNQELMKLYKDYGINPFGGCVPMLLQIPIFFGFYAMLGTAIELRNSKFLWVQDLSQPDTIWHIPGIGFPLNILPICMAVTMLWQMSLTPKTGDPVQQRIFMFVPLIFIIFCYNYASALALYWTVQNLFSIGQLYLTRDQPAPVPQKIAPPRKRK